MLNDELGNRMKNNYEDVERRHLTRRTPVVVRIDGRAFHTFTRGLQKPFDRIFIRSMQDTLSDVCKSAQGCVFGYTQSDEMSLILLDYQGLETSAFFDYNVQKVVSVLASEATRAFNNNFRKNVDNLIAQIGPDSKYSYEYLDTLTKKRDHGGTFDARCFNVPKEEVTNYFCWRQLDAKRNSINSVGQSYFVRKQLEGKNTVEIVDMLNDEFAVRWGDFPTPMKWGTAWKNGSLDFNMPLLKGDNREYIDELIFI